ncbi:MAG: zinc ribbon domain-containing protein [Dehalococcoidia bacterium]|nr:zinc ribbon domain-containing protein [Dehalococcoidia bacterium]
MPTYDYHCPQCGAQFEVSRPASRVDDPVACPRDGARTLRLLGLEHDGADTGGPSSNLGWAHAGHAHWPGTAPHGHA